MLGARCRCPAPAASGYQAYSQHVATGLTAVADGQWQFAVAPYAGDHARDLYAIHYLGTASNKVEVHVLSAASGYQSYVLHAATALGPSAPGQTSYLVDGTSGDLTAVIRSGTGSGRTEAHAQRRHRLPQLLAAQGAADGPDLGAQYQYDLAALTSQVTVTAISPDGP